MTAIKTSLKASLIATAIATFPLGGQAAGLGSLNVFSGLGQPLRAEIELNATPQELESLTAKIASAEAFRQSNLSYSPAMSALRLAVEKRGGGAVVRISSDRPLNEPFVDLLLELDWATGRMIREYTFLLDPVPLNAPAPVAARVDSPAAGAPVEQGARPASAAPAGSRASAQDGAAERYEVRRGDTLHRVAEAHRPDAASLDQMLIALFRGNPDAFDQSNINRLRAGAILNVPDEPEVLAVEPAQARREVVAHSADFEAYRKRLAGTIATRPSSDAPAAQSDSGAIVPRVEEPVTEGDARDRVEVSAGSDASGPRASTDSARLARLQALEEELVARDKALEEANSRLAALEESIREMQQLLVLRNQSLGELQRQAAPAAPADAAPVAPAPAASAEAPPAPVAPKPETTAEPTPAVVEAEAPAEQPGFLDEVLRDPKMLAGGGGILVLLLGYAGLRARRRNHAGAESADHPEIGGDLPLVTNSVFGATGGQNVNTSDTSIIHTDFSQSGLSAIDTDEGVDPVAEADVYMAYGRDAQAEEILLDALKADPSRAAIFLKLLEIYEQRKNAKQFEAVATDFYSRFGGDGAEWQKAAEMGRRIDPDNPLYGASGASLRAAAAGGDSRMAQSSSPLAAAGLATAAGIAAAAAHGGDANAEALDEDRPDLDFHGFSTGESALSGQPDDVRGSAADRLAGDAAALDFPEIAAAADVADVEPMIEALPEIDSTALDFDLDAGLGLGGEPFEPAPTNPARSAAASAEPAETNDELSFDLDLEPAPAQDADSTPAATADALMSATIVGDGADFALPELGGEFDAPDTAAAAQPDASFETFDLPAQDTGTGAAVSDADLEKTTFDSSLLDFDFNLEEPTVPSADAAPVFDLSSVGEDLESAAAPAPQPADAVPMFDLSSIDLDLGTEPNATIDETDSGAEPGQLAGTAVSDEALEEVDTKLELARAYDEMGDKDGARELIEEVLREGSVEQQAAGRRLLAQLA